MLALNVLHRPYSEFLKPLDLNQAAPFGFLLVEKAAVDLLGNSELTLRLPALLYGLGSLVLFFYFARHFLRSWELLVAVFLFAFSYRHIYYSSEVKQYGLDVTVVLAMSLIAVRVNSRSPNLAEWLYFGVAGAISLWFSYPAVFVLAAAGSVLSWKALLNRNWRAMALMCVPFGLWLASIGMLLPSLSATAANPYLLRYWESSFMPFPPKTMTDVRWFDSTFLGLFQNPVGLFPSALAALSFLTGSIVVAHRKKADCFILLSPIMFAMLASGLHRYPFNGRLMVFIIPAVLIAVSAGACSIAPTQAERRQKVIHVIVALALMIPSFSYAVAVLARPLGDEDIKSLLTHVRGHWRDGDMLYVAYESVPAFTYYVDRFAFRHDDYIEGQPYGLDAKQYIAQEVARCPGNRRVWLLFSHIRTGTLSDDQLWVSAIKDTRAKLQSLQSPGAAVYLYSEY